jgi:hydrogenase maturation protease
VAERVVVIGIGNPDRGDDGAGRHVAALLRGRLPDGVSILELDGEPTALLAALDGADIAILIDACVSGAPVGVVHRFDAQTGPLPESVSDVSTHGFGLAAAIELARALGQLPAMTIVYAIEGRQFAVGSSPSATVAAAASSVADRIRAELAAILA